MLVLFIAAVIPDAHTACTPLSQGPGLSFWNRGSCPKTALNPFGSQHHGHPWRTASAAAASPPFVDIPLCSCSPSFPTGVPNGDVSQHPHERWPCSVRPPALARQRPSPCCPPQFHPSAAQLLHISSQKSPRLCSVPRGTQHIF